MSVRGIDFVKPSIPTRCAVCYTNCMPTEEMLKQFCYCGCGEAVFTCMNCPTANAAQCYDDNKKCKNGKNKEVEKRS